MLDGDQEEIAKVLNRVEVTADLIALVPQFVAKYPGVKLAGVLLERYELKECRLLTVQQLADFAGWLTMMLLPEGGEGV